MTAFQGVLSFVSLTLKAVVRFEQNSSDAFLDRSLTPNIHSNASGNFIIKRVVRVAAACLATEKSSSEEKSQWKKTPGIELF